MDKDLPYLIALYFQEGVGPVIAKTLLAHFGSAENIFKSSSQEKAEVLGVPKKVAPAIQYEKYAELVDKEIDFINKNNIHTFSIFEDSYPQRLKEVKDAPYLLFQKGDTDLNSTKVVNIVGTRNATDYGKDITEQIVAVLAQQGVVIVSGMALGIDEAAHKAALRYDTPTVGVLGQGLHMVYPPQNISLGKKVLDHGGALLSEYPSSADFDKANFPMRNRIVAGMSDATIIIESAAKGGAMITTELAYSYNRDVLAVPGRANDKYSQGTNNLIKYLKAQMITSGEDVLRAMNWDKTKKPPVQRKLFLELSPEEQPIVDYLQQYGDTGIDILCEKLQQSPTNMASLLLQLELRGIIRTLPGKRYALC